MECKKVEVLTESKMNVWQGLWNTGNRETLIKDDRLSELRGVSPGEILCMVTLAYDIVAHTWNVLEK